MLTEIPKPYNTGFLSTEDVFVMNAGGNFADSVEPMEVIISCPHKRKRVSALTSEGVKINANAKWKPIFQQSGMLTGGTLGNSINDAVSWSLGLSVHQPWMNKKQYESTEPFSVTIPLSFVSSMGDPKAEVYDPCMALLSFVYPRQVGIEDELFSTEELDNGKATLASASTSLINKLENIGKTVIGDSAITTGLAKRSKETIKSENLVGAAASAYDIFSVPGTSLTGNKGDTVSISIGPVFNLGKVYLEKVDIEFSKTLNPLGYPLAAKVTLTASPVESCYCKSDGELVIFDQFSDNSAALNGLISAASKTAETAIDAVVTITKNAWGVLKDVGEAVTTKGSGKL